MFIIGLMIGLIYPSTNHNLNQFSLYSLYLLILLVSLSIGTDKSTFQNLKKIKIKIFLIPLTTIIGTTIGILTIKPFLTDISIEESLAIGYGFGYYSLSSIFITEISGPKLGLIALASNIFREILTLLFTPFLSKHFSKIAPICAGGATSMDTTLPIITKFSGKEFAIISITHGVILTLLVPILVTFVLKL